MDGMMMGLSDSSSWWARQLSLIYNKIFHFHSSSIAAATPNRHNETFTILIKFFRERAEQSHRIHLKSWCSGSHSSCVWGELGGEKFWLISWQANGRIKVDNDFKKEDFAVRKEKNFLLFCSLIHCVWVFAANNRFRVSRREIALKVSDRDSFIHFMVFRWMTAFSLHVKEQQCRCKNWIVFRMREFLSEDSRFCLTAQHKKEINLRSSCAEWILEWKSLRLCLDFVVRCLSELPLIPLHPRLPSNFTSSKLPSELHQKICCPPNNNIKQQAAGMAERFIRLLLSQQVKK